VKRPVRRGYLVHWAFALAIEIAYGMVASALAVPLAHREAVPDAIARRGAGCHVVGDQAGHAATEAAEAPSSDGDRHPTPDHFDCCTNRLGTVGTHVLASALVERIEPGARRARAPRPRMPARPRPWRVSLGRQPPAPSVGTTLAV
jgi:hypothetical protein